MATAAQTTATRPATCSRYWAEHVRTFSPAYRGLTMVVGGGCDEDQALLNAVLAVLKGDGHRPSASIVSNSWQIPIGDLSPQTVHAQPAYQKGVVPRSMSHVRVDGRTVVYQTQVNAGTSLAARWSPAWWPTHSRGNGPASASSTH